MEKGLNVKDIYDLTKEELQEELASEGEKSFRAKQIFSWIHGRGAKGFDEMSDLSKALRASLSGRYSTDGLETDTEQISRNDGTRKYLFELSDGNFIEGVFMRYRSWNTACISSQAGCAMGCRFCASSINGLARDLTAG